MNVELIHITAVSNKIQWEVRDWRNTKEISQYFIIDYITEDMHSNWLELQKKGITNSAYIICYNNIPIGCAYLRDINLTHKTLEWGIFIKPNANVFKGIGAIVEYHIHELIFNEYNIEKIHIEVLSTNLNVIKMHQKFGYNIEGTLEKHIIKDNKRLDIVLMALFKKDWEILKPKFSKMINKYVQ
jgi:UDP-4-amino-4,6-dideoxy-N-acetyl-beta-L-altrosamine N-acetyltransferase